MFATPSYAARLAHQFAEAPSLPPPRTRPFNKLALDFLDVEVEQGDNNDRDDSPSHWLGLVGLKSWASMPCFDLDFCLSSFVLFTFVFSKSLVLLILHLVLLIPFDDVSPNLILNHLETILQDLSSKVHSSMPIRSTSCWFQTKLSSPQNGNTF